METDANKDAIALEPEPGQFLAPIEIHGDIPPISQLLPELLTEVFSQYVFLWEADIAYDPTKVWMFPLLQVTHVSRFWRSTAISYHALWSRITPFHSECVREWLARSKECPLTILEDPHRVDGNEDYELSCKLIMQELPRIRSLELHPHIPALQFFLDSCAASFNLPAPLLRHYSLTVSGRKFGGLFDTLAWLLRNAPRLVKFRLQVMQMTLCWKDPQPQTWHFPQTLTNVAITGHLHSAVLDVMLSAIECLPMLEILGLNVKLQNRETAPAGCLYTLSPRVKLVALGRSPDLLPLCISNPATACYLLNHLSFPPTASLYIHTALQGNELSDTGLASSLASKWSSEEAVLPFIRSTTIYVGYTRRGVFRQPYISISGGRHPLNGQSKIRLSFDGPISQPVTLLKSNLPILPLSQVQTLYLRVKLATHDMPGAIGLRDAFRGMVSLSFLHVEGWSEYDLIGLLSAARVSGEDAVPTCIFPELRTLVLEDVYFSGDPENLGLPQLAACLKGRAKFVGGGITRLVLRGCLDDAEPDLALLTAIVEKVVREDEESDVDEYSLSEDSE